jgi:hypothetical protein
MRAPCSNRSSRLTCRDTLRFEEALCLPQKHLIGVAPFHLRAIYLRGGWVAQTHCVCWHQHYRFGCESRDVSQSGNICAMECETKAGLCRRLSRRVNMMARKNPVKAPRNASVTERLLNVRSPWLVRMNPVYAIATVQRITRTGNMAITSECLNPR